MKIAENLQKIKDSLPEHVTLVAVSKTKPIEDIQEAYEAGQRHFGENKVQELLAKADALPKDIHWHMIGHLQSKKAKQIVGSTHLIHGIDSIKLLETVNRRAELAETKCAILLQVHIAQEDSKFGFDANEIDDLLANDFLSNYPFIELKGLMGMATFTDNQEQVNAEFASLNSMFLKHKEAHKLETLSMGMSGDYQLAISQGSNMVRVGSAIFGGR